MHILLMTIIVLLLIIIVLVLFFYFKLRKINTNLLQHQNKIQVQKRELEKVNVELTASNIASKKHSDFKNQFLANMSHEIRTPLNAILGYAKLLKKNLKEDNNIYYINQVIQATDNMLIIINDLLDFSKIEAGKMVIEKVPFNPVKIVSQAISTLKFRAEEKNIKLEIHIDPSIPSTIMGDPYRLSQILINLISNAIKFSPEGQVVTIETSCDIKDNMCKMSFFVKDHGVGIPENKLESIFESFSQVSRDTSRIAQGTGLGLSIVKRLIELQDGTITVKSKLKEGTEFMFYIPYYLPELNGDKNLQPEDGSRVLEQDGEINILLVEDNKINQELAKDTIASWGMNTHVDIVENGKEALLAIQDNNYDVILMDIQMPIMDGHEATEYIRNSLSAPKNKIPIIGMSAHALSSEKELALKKGMNDYLVKPFNPEELKQKILFFVKR